MKKKALVAALLMICMSLIGFGTVAYFTADKTATNVITAGSISIVLDETAFDENGTVSAFKNVEGVMPGTEISKIVTIKNTGDNSAFVRMTVDVAATLADGNEEDAPSVVGIDYNTDDWTLKDGYWYYNAELLAGETTPPLLTTVSFVPEMDNTYQNGTFEVVVAGYAVQSANNGSSALMAAGWPE